MPLLAIPVLLQLANACPSMDVPDARIAATARMESGLNSLALHDNTTGQSFYPATVAEAVEIARPLLAQRHSLDAGVMQVNSQNWPRLGLTVETVFDPALNVCAGKAVLAEAYAIERAVSCRYNSGKPVCGSRYPDRLEAAMTAAAAGPVEVAAAAPVSLSIISQPLAPPPPRPPAWDVYAAVRRPNPAQNAPVKLTASR